MIIDCHIHGGLGSALVKTKLTSVNKDSVNAMKKVLNIYRESGVFALRDGGDITGVGRLLRDISKDTDLIYRTPIRAFYKKGLYGEFLGEPVTDQKDAIKKMDVLFKESPDFIKIILTGIMSFTEFGICGPIGFNKSELTAMIEHAHDFGKKVMIHANSPEGIRLGLEAGGDTIEHGYGIDDGCIEALKEYKSIWIPTLAPFANIAKCKDDSPMKKFRRVSKNYFRQHQKQVKKANTIGVNIGLGSDAGATLVPHGQGTLDELSYLLDCGLTEEKLENIGKKVIGIK